MTYEVLWHARALRQLLDLHWRQASFVDAAVIRYASSGEGFVRKVATADGEELRATQQAGPTVPGQALA